MQQSVKKTGSDYTQYRRRILDSDLREYLGVIMNGPRPPIPNLDKILKASEDKDKELWDYFFKNVLGTGPKVWYDDVREQSTAEILGRLYTGIWEKEKL